MNQYLKFDEDEMDLLTCDPYKEDQNSQWFASDFPYAMRTDFNKEGKIDRFTFVYSGKELHMEQLMESLDENTILGIPRDGRIIYDINFMNPIDPLMISIQKLADQIQTYSETIDDNAKAGNMAKRFNAILISKILSNWKGRINTPKGDEQ